MSDRVFNFGAGPCTLPREVLEEARDEFVDHHGAGMALFEMSHRSAAYLQIHEEALTATREVFAVPDDFAVLFVQGGASLQFAMVPMNLLAGSDSGGYAVTGHWAKRALADAGHHGDVYAAWDGAADDYTRTPGPGEPAVRPGTRYLHITSNETIGGIRFPEWPDPGVPLVADMSSDMMSRPIPWERFDLVYGGVQKNLGPPGMAIVFVRTSALERANRDLASYLRYDVHADNGSLYNTPPMFTVWIVGKVLAWMQARGGLAAMEEAAARRADAVYAAIDGSEAFYRSPVDPGSRSMMNVVFRLPDEDLERQFLAGAGERGMVGLKGHRIVGGCRASLYNAMPLAGAEALAAYMGEFRGGHA